jgi:FixJ family two-component response regulator
LTSRFEQLQWRRNKVLELSSQGHSERDIAATLQVALGTVNRDLHILRDQAKRNIAKYIDERLPLEYQKCMIGLDAILVQAWDIA